MSTEPNDRTLLLRRFQEPMRDLVARARAIDIRAFEVEGNGPPLRELHEGTAGLLRDATSVLSTVLANCEGGPRPIGGALRDGPDALLAAAFLPFERAMDATVAAARPGSRKAVEEVAFMAQLELRQRTERLDRVTVAHGTVVVLGECDSSLRRVRKALAAVDAAIARAEAVPPLLDFTSELNTSLAVRRAYAKLRARVVEGGEPTPATVRARIRRVGTQLAMLVGWDVYPEMRVRDRLLLRELQQRVLDWLREGDRALTEAGLRLWRDVASSVEMFSLVNRRQELQEHDRAVIREVMTRLSDTPAGAISPAILERLGTLEGLDAEVDATLVARDLVPAESLKRLLTALADRIGLDGDWAEEPPSW